MSIKLDAIEISIIVPLYNESENIEHLFTRLITVINQLHTNYEIICINDGSQDDTLNKLIQLHQQNSAIKIINLSRNFGKEIAL